MASVTDQELKQMSQEERVTAFGMRTEQLTGRSSSSSLKRMKGQITPIRGHLMWISTNVLKSTLTSLTRRGLTTRSAS